VTHCKPCEDILAFYRQNKPTVLIGSCVKTWRGPRWGS